MNTILFRMRSLLLWGLLLISIGVFGQSLLADSECDRAGTSVSVSGKENKRIVEFPLLPRFTGKYTLNPVKVELMYFPVVNANNEGRRIWITERNTKE